MTRTLLERRAQPGLYHCVNAGTTSWEDIARTISTAIGKPLRMKALTLEAAGLHAPRPLYSALSPAKRAAAGVVLPHWSDALARYRRTV